MKKYIIKKMFWLEKSLVEKIKAEAKKKEISGSALMTHIITKWFEK